MFMSFKRCNCLIIKMGNIILNTQTKDINTHMTDLQYTTPISSLKLSFLFCCTPCRHFNKLSRLHKSLYTGRMAARRSNGRPLSLEELFPFYMSYCYWHHFDFPTIFMTAMPCMRKLFCQCPQRFDVEQCQNIFEGYLF